MEKLTSNNNTLKKEIEYHYEIKTIKIKKGKTEINQKYLIFYTEDDENTRFIEDIAEELVGKHSLPFTTTTFYECQQEGNKIAFCYHSVNKLIKEKIQIEEEMNRLKFVID
jgi:hypothetical protein